MTASYLALADSLERTISGLGPGAKLPSEHQLCATNHVSRVTARGALQELEHRHLVRRTRGSGTYAALRIPYPIRPHTSPSWSQIVRSAGHTPSYQLLSVEHVEASHATASALVNQPGTLVLRVERLGLVDGEAAAHQLMHFPLDCFNGEANDLQRFQGLLETHLSTTALLARRFEIHLERSATRAELRPIGAARASDLDLNGRPMAWHTETINRCQASHRTIEHTESWLRADSFQVFMEFGPTNGPPPFLPPSPQTTIT